MQECHKFGKRANFIVCDSNIEFNKLKVFLTFFLTIFDFFYLITGVIISNMQNTKHKGYKIEEIHTFADNFKSANLQAID